MSNSKQSKDGGIYDSSVPQNPRSTKRLKGATTGRTLKWKDRLYARGLSDGTIQHFGIKSGKEKDHQPGWEYPVHPNIKARRWKNFDSQGKPKYRWCPKQPGEVKFYDPDGKLEDYVREANGVLWLASGEPDTWALWEGGIYNATCTFNGEAKNIPDWFVPELQRISVKEIHIAPDRDKTGVGFARKLHTVLEDSGIALVTHELPFEMGSKGDINRYLIEIGREKLRTSLESLPYLEPGARCSKLPPVTKSPRTPDELYERWCTEVVEATAQQTWGFSKPSSNGFSKNFRCPFHDDENPSAGWSYTWHGVNCFVCGEHNTQEVAQLLGVQSWEDYKASQNQPGYRRGTNGYTSPSDEVPNDFHDSSPYSIDMDGRMVYHKENGENDGGELVRIADFEVTITEEIIDEDGQKTYRLEGRTIYGTLMDTTISAQDFEDTRSLKATLAAVSDSRTAIYPGMERYLAPAIHKLTTQSKRTRRFTRTGWADGSFLIPGREPEGVTIQPNSKLPYLINPNASLEKGLNGLDHLIRAVGPENSLPILTAMFQAPMAHLAIWRNERYAVFIQGRTGMFKTSWTQAAMAIYGPDFANRDDLLNKMGDGGTTRALMARATYAWDLPILIDNYKPNTGGGKKDFVNLIHNILEGGDRDRLTRDAQLRETKPVFAWPVFTGEDVVDNDPASLARILLVRFEVQPDNAGSLLAVAQRDAEHLCAVGNAWLDSLESSSGKQRVAQELEHFEAVRQEYLRQLQSVEKNAANTRRIATNLATNHITWSVLCAHPQLGPVFHRYKEQYLAGIQRIVTTMAGATTESQVAIRFLGALRELLASERYIMAKLDGSGCNLDTDRDRVLGYYAPDGGVYLLPDVTRQAVERLTGDGLDNASSNALYKQLDDLGYIASKGKDCVPKNARVGQNKRPTRVLHMKAEALSEEE